VNQYCLAPIGAINPTTQSFLPIFCTTLWMMAIGGNVYADIRTHEIDIVSTASIGSSANAPYTGSWWFVVEAKMYIVRKPFSCTIPETLP
jgi:hypothetical protein